MRNFALLLSILAVLAAGVWLMLRPGDPAAPAGDSATTSEIAAAPAPAAPLDSTEMAPAARVDTVPELPAAVPAAALAAYEPPDAGADAILVRVVGPDGQTPVPGAEVFHVDGRKLDQNQALGALGQLQDVHAVLELLARRFLADAQGEVRVPYAAGELVLGARTPDLFHLQMFPAVKPGATLLLTLQPRHQIEVQVFGAEGRPVAGVPVTFILSIAGERQPMLVVPTQGKDGIATLRDVRPLLLVVPAPAKQVEIALAVPLAEEVVEPISLDVLPEEPYILELPPVGEVLVEVLDFSGQPVAEEVTVALRKAGGDSPFAWQPPAVPKPNQATARTSGGRARFPFVGLGLQLEAAVELRDYPKAVVAQAEGPASPGQVARIVLRPQFPPAVLIARAVDPEGKPYSRQRLELTYQATGAGGEQDWDWETLTTGADGRFRYPIAVSDDPPPASRSIELRLKDERDDVQAQGELSLASSYPPGEFDLGDVVLAPPQVIAEGTVLAPGGTPVAGAEIRLEWEEFYGTNNEHSWWNSDWSNTATSDASGAFRLRGKPRFGAGDAGQLRVNAQADGYSSGTAPILLGEHGVIVRLGMDCSLSGRLLVDDDVPADAVELRLVEVKGEGEGEAGSTTRHDTSAAAEGGAFAWKDLQPGRYAVEVYGHEGEPPVQVISDIQVLAGQENRDPRLDPIDLRGLLRLIRLQCKNEDGEPVNGVSMQSLDPEHRFWRHEWAPEIVFLTASGSLNLHLSAEGYQDVDLREVRDSQEVIFRRGAELLFVLSQPLSLPEGYSLTVNLSRVNSHHWGANWSSGFDERGEARIAAPGSGDYQLSLGVMQRNERTTTIYGVDSQAVSPGKITILDGGTPQTFTLQVDAAEIDKTIKEF